MHGASTLLRSTWEKDVYQDLSVNAIPQPVFYITFKERESFRFIVPASLFSGAQEFDSAQDFVTIPVGGSIRFHNGGGENGPAYRIFSNRELASFDHVIAAGQEREFELGKEGAICKVPPTNAPTWRSHHMRRLTPAPCNLSIQEAGFGFLQNIGGRASGHLTKICV